MVLPRSVIKGFDKRRLRNLLAVFFLGLAIPTLILIWQTYSQLKWEAFHQYRGVAEELTRRIDARLKDMIASADARSFADYSFLVVTGDPSANFLQRSPLAAFPVVEDLPGVIGYFQVDTLGTFSTPLLPPRGTAGQKLGIGANEFVERQQLAQNIMTILAENQLVQSRADLGLRRDLVALPAPKSGTPARARIQELATELDKSGIVAEAERQKTATSSGDEAAASGGFIDADRLDSNALEPIDDFEEAQSPSASYSQQVFDRLTLPRKNSAMQSGSAGTIAVDDAPGAVSSEAPALYTIGKVTDLKLDAALQKKSKDVELKEAVERGSGRATAFTRAEKRREQIALPESIAAEMPAAPADELRLMQTTSPQDLRISTFESEIDPLEFSRLDSGHFVLFRNVWRDGERYIQGLLLDQHALIDEVINTRFMETALSDMSNLIVAYQDDVIHTISARKVYSRDYASETLQGTLLYQSRLSAPLASLELIYNIKRLPPGPGASLLVWVTVILALVFLGGFYALYRLGLSQINLARQQQDFVSAVSHELKTPLTSIRMYGEMLKEGWADEEKRQSYYEFIHDESERLTRLISNVLQLANITRNEPQFDARPVLVGTLMSQIESKIASQIEQAGFELRFKRDDLTDSASINIDENCFPQIIINLVDNAIKFSKHAEHKCIEISSGLSSDKSVEFSVRDFGPGIARDQMKKIFTLFYRSESELTRETVGTGIGLAIVHQLTVAMNGKVDVINRNPGTEFRIMFPRS